MHIIWYNAAKRPYFDFFRLALFVEKLDTIFRKNHCIATNMLIIFHCTRRK